MCPWSLSCVSTSWPPTFRLSSRNLYGCSASFVRGCFAWLAPELLSFISRSLDFDETLDLLLWLNLG